MNEQERIQNIRDRFKMAERVMGTPEAVSYAAGYWSDVPFLLSVVDQRDKALSEKDEALAELAGVYEAQYASLIQLLKKQNEIMLEALELTEVSILNGDDPELVLSHVEHALSAIEEMYR